MFRCIGCSKQSTNEGDEQVRRTGTEGGTQATNQAVKSLTSQLKDMALKFTGAKQPRSSGAGPSTERRGQRPIDYDNNSEGVQRMGGNQDLRRHEQVTSYAAEVHDSDEDIMWVAQVEPGIHITFVPLPTGGNDLRRIRFNRDIYDRWQAQQWWGSNYDRIMELYNVQRFNRQALNTPPNSEDEQRYTPPISRQPSGRDSPVAAWLNNDSTLRNVQFYNPSEITMDQGNNSQNLNAAEIDDEGMVEDVPGVFLTIRQLPDGSKDLRRVRFSRKRFDEEEAKKWWEDNKERIQAEYL